MSLKITIPKPCHENWEGMTPDEKGRFCSLCAKSVVDFTAMPRSDVEDYLLANADKKICGRFNNNQIDNAPVTLHIPTEVLYKQKHSFRNMFMLALVVCMGSVLFSCRDHNGKHVDIMGDTVYVPQDSIADNKMQKVTDPAKCNTSANDTVSKAKLKPIPEPEPFLTGDVVVDPVSQRVEKDVYNLNEVDAIPEFPGGITKLYEYINTNLTVPKSPESGNRKIYVNFIVEKDGSLGAVKILRGLDESMNTGVITILKNSPKWIPAKIGEENVRSLYTLPIVIKPQE